MKKFIVALVFASALLPTFAFAQGFSADVSYGQSGPAVLEVQEFLGAHNYFSGPYTGAFYSLTLAAVKRYQAAENIPTTGYFGPLSRAAAQKIVASETVDNESATTTSPVNQTSLTTWPQVYTLSTGMIISVDQNGTLSVLYTPPTSTGTPSSTTTNSTNSQQTQMSNTGNSQTAGSSAPAPFVRTGDVSIAAATALQNGSIATFTIKNDTNEAVKLSNTNPNSFFAVTDNKIPNWTPGFSLRYFIGGRQISDPTFAGIAPGTSADVSVLLYSAPPAAGTFNLAITNLQIIGLTSGDFITATGFPVSLGSISAQ